MTARVEQSIDTDAPFHVRPIASTHDGKGQAIRKCFHRRAHALG
jgi:hypothetical protein